jgi:hypothetical protein
MFDCIDQILDSIKLMVSKFNDFKQEELPNNLLIFLIDRIANLSCENERKIFSLIAEKNVKNKKSQGHSQIKLWLICRVKNFNELNHRL